MNATLVGRLYLDSDVMIDDMPLSASAERYLAELAVHIPEISMEKERGKLRKGGTVITDITLTDLRTAAAGGCVLNALLAESWPAAEANFQNRKRLITLAPSTLAADVSGDMLSFGIPAFAVDDMKVVVDSAINEPDTDVNKLLRPRPFITFQLLTNSGILHRFHDSCEHVSYHARALQKIQPQAPFRQGLSAYTQTQRSTLI